LSLQYVADGGTIAEEVISTIRTAQAFGTQMTLSGFYDAYVLKAHGVDLKAAVWHGGSLATFFFIIYSSYGLGLCRSKLLPSVAHTRCSIFFWNKAYSPR
jgi:ATP-binding cassette subfamily B (MDR/TAP) protein 1